MFRVYSDLFYKNTELKETLETDYINKIEGALGNLKVKRKKRKNGTLYPICNIINEGLNFLNSKYASQIPELPQDLKDLLVLSPKEIATIYEFYKNRKDFKDDVGKYFGVVYGIRNGKILVLPYEKVSEKIADFFIDNQDKGIYSINTCFYCNKAYVNSYFSEEMVKKQQFDLDHFIPKTKCPLFSLCLYNFVLSCQICNSRIKGAEEYYSKCSKEELEKLLPTSENYDLNSALKFRIIPNQPIFDGDKVFQDFNKKKECFDIEFMHCNSDSDLYEKETNGFDIIKRYDFHKREFLRYIDKSRKYPPSYFLLLSKIVPGADASALEEAIFDREFRNDEKQIFQKIYNDIDEQL